MRYVHVGWCKSGIHDKVWGVICLREPEYRESIRGWVAGKYVSFWGRRGTKLQTKMIDTIEYEIGKLFDKKLNSGYKKIDENELDEVYPEFQSDLEKTAFWATFKI